MRSFDGLHLDGIVYLRSSPDTCLRRLKRRSREEESTVDAKYLGQLHNRHENWLLRGSIPGEFMRPVLVLDTTAEFETDAARSEHILALVQRFMQRLAATRVRELSLGMIDRPKSAAEPESKGEPESTAGSLGDGAALGGHRSSVEKVGAPGVPPAAASGATRSRSRGRGSAVHSSGALAGTGSDGASAAGAEGIARSSSRQMEGEDREAWLTRVVGPADVPLLRGDIVGEVPAETSTRSVPDVAEGSGGGDGGAAISATKMAVATEPS